MTRVIHTGDTHIGYRQYHSPERRRDFLAAFERVVEDAVADDVDAVVHAGDLFHDRRPDLPDLLGTLSALRELDEAGIPFLAVVGNHESTRGGQWLDLYESLGLATRLGSEPVTVGDAAFYGLDHVPESRREALEYEFDPHDERHAVLVGHGLFEPFAHGNWDTETVLSEATVAFDAMLLGDNHTPDTAEVLDTWVTYCGSTERASTAERDGRGYNVVEFRDGDVDVRRRALETRPFVFVEVELGPSEGVGRVRDRVREHDVTDAVVVVEITGDGEPVAPAAIEEFAAERGALVARVTDRREVDTEVDVSVTFADPDAAVRERVAELGLSSVARDVDDVVRGEAADSNVRERVKRRVEERFEADEFPAVAETAPGDDAAEPGNGSDRAEPDEAGDAANPKSEPEQTGATASTADPPAEATGSDGGSRSDDRDPSDEGTEASDRDDAEDRPAGGQVTMEDYR